MQDALQQLRQEDPFEALGLELAERISNNVDELQRHRGEVRIKSIGGNVTWKSHWTSGEGVRRKTNVERLTRSNRKACVFVTAIIANSINPALLEIQEKQIDRTEETQVDQYVRVLRAAKVEPQHLYSKFVWSETKEGHDFWDSVAYGLTL